MGLNSQDLISKNPSWGGQGLGFRVCKNENSTSGIFCEEASCAEFWGAVQTVNPKGILGGFASPA